MATTVDRAPGRPASTAPCDITVDLLQRRSFAGRSDMGLPTGPRFAQTDLLREPTVLGRIDASEAQ